MKIEFRNSSEYFRMSGPFIGDAYIDGQKLLNKFLDGNLILSNDQKTILLNCFIERASKNRDRIDDDKVPEFRILLWTDNKYYLSSQSFESLFLMDYKDGLVFFHHAFYEQSEYHAETLEFNTANFREIKYDEVFGI